MTPVTVLVVGDYRQTLTVARSLKRRGHRVIGAVSNPKTSHIRRSRAVDGLWYHPPVGSEDFRGSLEWAIAFHQPDVIFPVGDGEIRWFAEREEDFDVPLACVSLDIATACQDKPALLAMGEAVGVQFTESAVVHDLGEMAATAEALGYPCIIKSNDPLQRVLGSKGIICHNPDELRASIPDWPETHDSLIAQRYLDGPRHNLYFAAERGEVIGLVQVEILRTDRPDGTGYAVDGITRPADPGLLAQTEALARELKYHGVGCTQFLVAPDGETSFLELNPRLGANFVVVDAAGLDLAGIAVDIALDAPIDPPRDLDTDLRYAWGLGEMDGLRTLASQGEVGPREALRWIGRVLRTAIAADVHVTWSARDPLPSLALLWRDVLVPIGRESGRRLRKLRR